jgi:hypothetical protein
MYYKHYGLRRSAAPVFNWQRWVKVRSDTVRIVKPVLKCQRNQECVARTRAQNSELRREREQLYPVNQDGELWSVRNYSREESMCVINPSWVKEPLVITDCITICLLISCETYSGLLYVVTRDGCLVSIKSALRYLLEWTKCADCINNLMYWKKVKASTHNL